MSEAQAPTVAPDDVPGLPQQRLVLHEVAVLTGEQARAGGEGTTEQVVSALEVRGLCHLPTTRQTVDTAFRVTAHLPTELAPGDLLVTDAANARIVLVRDGVSRRYLDIWSWCDAHVWDVALTGDRQRLYISVSGMRAPALDHTGIPGSSAILEVDTTKGRLLRVIESIDRDSGLPYPDRMLDIAGIAVTADGRRLLMADFNNWQGDGKVLALDLATEELSVVADGLDQPSTVTLDGPDHVLVANTRQPHGKAGGGQVVRLAIGGGEREVLADVRGVPASLIGVARLDNGALLGTMSEGTQEQCVVVQLEQGSSEPRVLWHPKPGFLGSGITAQGDTLWVAETLRRRAYQLEADGSVRRHVQVYEEGDEDDLRFFFRGFDTLESVRVVT